MKTPLQTISLSAFVVIVASCSIPVIDSLDAAPPVAIVDSVPQANTAQIDFHRQPTVASCGSVDCRRPTQKTLAVDYRPDASQQLPFLVQPAIAKLLNEPHGGTGVIPETSRERRLRSTSEPELSVYFDYASAILKRDARTQLDEALNGPIRPQKISIRGRTDGRGARPANQRLALARAQAVRQHLLSRDPSLSDVIDLEARGTCCYVAPNATPGGRALNRRVEITVMRLDPDA